MNKWDKFKKLSRREHGWLWQAWLLLPIVKLSLWLVGYRRTLTGLQTLGARQSFSTSVETDAAMLGRLVNVAARYSVLPINCLPKSLVLWWLLQCAGVAADLRIGVQKESDALAAHAWVECAGVPVSDKEGGRYIAFAPSFAHLEERPL